MMEREYPPAPVTVTAAAVPVGSPEIRMSSLPVTGEMTPLPLQLLKALRALKALKTLSAFSASSAFRLTSRRPKISR